ncbi:MAG: non-homologous end-joining DNA ligase [Actinomycetes bacterium]
MADPLDPYRRKRHRGRTPEPIPEESPRAGSPDGARFVIQEHHARRLHWDLRLERDGVLVSWAVPKGLPLDPKRNNLAVHTEDHPLEYMTFSGEIPKGEYGGGSMTIWDTGTYDTETWTEREVKVVLHGSRVSGRYVLFRTGGDDWMVHRMDPPPEAGWEPLPRLVRPMLAVSGERPPPREDGRWGYEMKWDGVRAVVYAEGGQLRLLSRSDRDVTVSYPELRPLGEALGSRACILDGEVVAFSPEGRVSFAALQARMHVAKAEQARRLSRSQPVTLFLFDVLHLDGHSTLALPYRERRKLLESLGLDGPRWVVPPYFPGAGDDAMATSEAQGLEGIVAKRLDSAYEPGRRSRSWLKVKHERTQEVVVGGWRPGAGRRTGAIGSLLMGVQTEDGLMYVGHVGSGFSDSALADLSRQLEPLARETSPFATPLPRPDSRDARWVEPRLVGEVAYGEWTPDERLRHPTWRGLRADKDPAEVTREDVPGGVPDPES